MRVILDIETNSLVRPTKIWVVCLKDIDTNSWSIYRNLLDDPEERAAFVSLASTLTLVVGHNVLDYDIPVIMSLIPECKGTFQRILEQQQVSDTLILSKLVGYSRPTGHSVESYGEEFGLEKIKFNDFKQYSQALEDYCVRDVDISHKIYLKYLPYLSDNAWLPSIRTEHRFQGVVNSLHNNGFGFDSVRAKSLLDKVTKDLSILDKDILEQFPSKLRLVREVHPTLTKHGTLNRKDFRWIKDGNLSDYNGYSFSKCSWSKFNPSSHKQLVEVLNAAGWAPTDKTKTHIEVERELNRLKYTSHPEKTLRLEELHGKLKTLEKSGYKINENNLTTLPLNAPAPARTLAKRILLESRRRTLVEWLSLVLNGRIHGKFIGIGAWTHRMAHQNPNLANIPNEYKEDGTKKLLGRELRSLWRAPRKRLLVGVDAEGIQLRIFAHYINDKDFIEAIVNGRKENKTDPHSLNASILGCSRQAAKRFIYAWLLGAGNGKLAEILGVSRQEAEAALGRLYERYSGLAYLKREVIPADARRGWFKGLDQRKVGIPGDTVGNRAHLCMSGYLQNGEAIVMKMASLRWENELIKDDSLLVNLVHDEWQTEVPNNMEVAIRIADIQAQSLRLVGEELGLNCPLAGSYYNEDKKDYTISTTWADTH